ncbi:decaprenyl-phosphate phosphoribosyltransferase [Streptomyces chryseus]|uniref:decaprenyl-phosphate phosphoribosyltransferase n=1 Tax=Streptomyces chryseus TaxID=68186 RepID=UPI00110FA3D9|nr:decaprenyl-phosphate phosphoribosyltransferase [Streptomyces chryseus]GGX38604.1 decaprenyl-phosphate phosphoribosyltransferase [Streptomyces chryseus]
MPERSSGTTSTHSPGPHSPALHATGPAGLATAAQSATPTAVIGQPRRAAPPRAPGRRPLSLPAGLLRTARPRQWVKNVLVLAAPAAAGELASAHAVARLALVFVLFTAAASAVYLINDARDADADRAHPVKCRRPVAAGEVPVPVAYAAGALLAVLAATAAALLCDPMTAALLTAYVVMQLAYCVWLKHILVVDLVVVTTGFLMRAMIGGVALQIPLSRWFLITAGFGALFMVAAKRYSEAVQMAARPEKRGATRALLDEYTTGYLRFVWQLAAGVAVLGYCLWALESGGTANGSLLPWRQLSMVAFILSVLRYAVFADRGTAGAPEDVVLRDRGLAVIGLVWVAMYGLAVADL